MSAEPSLVAIEPLSERLGHNFSAPELLELALTHRSWAAENESVGHNERLEFLGDSVLGLVITEQLYRTHPELPEGAMAKARAAVVSALPLAEVARSLGFGPNLRLGKGEETTGGRFKPSILADALEAVIGALYLDGGWATANSFVLGAFSELLTAAASEPGLRDFKTRLQEIAARLLDAVPDYAVIEDGPDHDKHFWATVAVAGELLGEGEGRSKKQAQQAAAEVAWKALNARPVPTKGRHRVGTRPH